MRGRLRSSIAPQPSDSYCLFCNDLKQFCFRVEHETDAAISGERKSVVGTFEFAIYAVVGGPGTIKSNFGFVIAGSQGEGTTGPLAILTLGHLGDSTFRLPVG